MKRLLLACFLLISCITYSQTTYYWVGDNNDSINVVSNWNTVPNGTGTSRPANNGPADILVFDGINISGGPFTVGSTAGITCAQLRYINGANVNITRTVTGTTTIALAGATGDDFFIDATSRAGFTSTVGSVRIDMCIACTGRINGEMAAITTQQFRITNTTIAGPAGNIVFTSGARFYTNITGASSYAFGSSTQAGEKAVTFEAGSHLYYDGGNSPHGSGSPGGTPFSAIDMRPGSTWHHRAPNAGLAGNFFNRKSFGDIIVENNATLTASGTIYQINNLTIESGSAFITADAGQTVVTGDVVVNGTLASNAPSTNELMLAGTTQSISGSGSVSIASFIIAGSADVTLNKNIVVDKSVRVYGKLNWQDRQISGNATFRADAAVTPVNATGNVTVDRSYITGFTGITTGDRGLLVSGAGIAPNTSIVSFTSTNDTAYLSKPVLASGTGVSLTVTTGGATLVTAHANGFNPASGSLVSTGTQTFDNGINYIINGATTWPFGITTAATPSSIHADFIEINAPVTVNRGFAVDDHLTVNAKLVLRPPDTARINAGAVLNGSFSATNYIATDYTATGEQGILRYDGMTTSTLLPVGTIAHYLPVTLNPAVVSDFTATVFEGITQEGTITGTPLTPAQKLTVLDAVWNINRVNGSGNSDVQLGWDAAVEGTTFSTLPDTDIGVIRNIGTAFSLPLGPGDNTANTASANVSSFGAFSAGAVPQVDPFVFNPLPVKTYGDADFNGGATSLNTTQPIVYSSSNNAVATIVAGNIHITGAGTADITASQASDGVYPAASVTQTLTVNPATLTIAADNKTKFEGQANPALTITYTGFITGENASNLLTPAIIATTAVQASPAGTYPITVSGATSNNYTITFVNGTLTVQPRQTQTITFPTIATKTYGNADFAANATSTNNTIPVVLTSSNAAVATIVGSNMIHIVGAGTATITASQAGNPGYFPAADVVRQLTVNKAALTIRVRDTTKTEGTPNPPFTITYTGFVPGETPANLLTPVVATTTATTAATPGPYPIIISGGTSNNYNVTIVNGKLTVIPAGGNNIQFLNAFMSNSTTLTVRVQSPEPTLGDVTVYDFHGRPVARKNLFMPIGFISTDINISTLGSGIYIVTVRGNGVNLKTTVAIIK